MPKLKKPTLNDLGSDEPRRRKKTELTPMTVTELAEVKRLVMGDCDCDSCTGTARIILAYEAIAGPLPKTKPKKKFDLTRFETEEETEKKETPDPPTL